MVAEKERDETTSSNGEEPEAWGTLEELLLACAVKLHGFDTWDSIADELRKRTKKPFSPFACRQKYADLKRRFVADERDIDAADSELLRMVEELRKLRVEELKREVQRHDDSIVSLQLKVRRLEEERGGERSTSKAGDEQEREALSDLRNESNGNATAGTAEEPDRSSPAEGRSFNESNSTNHHKADVKAASPEPRELDHKGENRSEPDPVPNIEQGKEAGSGSREGTSRPGESVSDSKRDKQQQSSDVQSSASLSKKKRRRFRGLGGGGGSSGDELEAEEVSPANKRMSVKPQPLIRFLEILRSHKHGSVFQRRLPSQETEKYRNVIRQHMDLDTVQSRLDKGVYCDFQSKFHRDLLLIFTNAVMFYRKSSAEHIAARELRKLVIDEISQGTRKPTKPIQPTKPDPEPQHLEPVVKKPRSSSTMVVCRRRSSSSMQALSESMKKKEDHSNTNTSNENVDDKSNSKSGSKAEKSKVDLPPKKGDSGGNSSSAPISRSEKSGGDQKKLLPRERSGLGRGGGGAGGGLKMSETSGKKMITKETGNDNNREKIGKITITNISSNKEDSSEGEAEEAVKKKPSAGGDQKQQIQEKGASSLKKQGVANFLKRMKQNSPSSQEKAKKKELEEEEEEKERGRKEKIEIAKKRGGSNVKKGGREVEAVATRRRGERESPMMTRRSGGGGNGRPPKRKVSAVSTPESGKGGRSGGGGRDGGEKAKKKPRR